MKTQLAVLCGGQSAEHEVSIVSAKNVIQALDKNKYDILIIIIAKNGEWYLCQSLEKFINTADIQNLLETDYCQKATLILGQHKKPLITLNGAARAVAIDVVFPVLHGSNGEDGTMQGLLELANIPYVGPGVLGSAICMDKVIAKRLLCEAKIPNAKFLTFSHHEKANIHFETIMEKLGLPFFIKPANTGSSVGISKVKTPAEFTVAVELAFQYDHKIIMEEFIKGREIECSVLGNEIPETSLPGEIIPHHEFYTYEAKYIDPNGATLVTPAELPKPLIVKIQTLAKQVYQALNCEGMARIDFFVTADDKLYVNEANTIPGFTQISQYPKMWAASGLPYSELLDKLIGLALERFKRNRVLVHIKDKQLNSI